MQDDIWNRRRRGSGLLFLLFVIGAMAWPLWHWRHADHPLAGEERIDLCALLRDAPGIAGLKPRSYQPSDGAGGCEWHDADDRIRLDATLYTIRSLAESYYPPKRIDSYYEDWRYDVRARAMEFSEEGEPGERILRYTIHHPDSPRRHWMIEDDGVLLWVRSNFMGQPGFDSLDEPIRALLRAKPEASPAISVSLPDAASSATSPDGSVQP